MKNGITRQVVINKRYSINNNYNYYLINFLGVPTTNPKIKPKTICPIKATIDIGTLLKNMPLPAIGITTVIAIR